MMLMPPTDYDQYVDIESNSIPATDDKCPQKRGNDWNHYWWNLWVEMVTVVLYLTIGFGNE
jgi:hypothetical protein